MLELIRRFQDADRDKVALLLSVVPGAGHLYKRHYVLGFGILIAGNLLAAWLTVLLAFGTGGFALPVVPAFYFIAVAASAYALPDWHGRHDYLHPWTREKGGGGAAKESEERG